LRLFSYIVNHDTGFAPNPFFGYCSLACCKPVIRRCANPGDWIIGLSNKSTGNRLIYAMSIDKKITYSDYWNSVSYNKKKPRNDTSVVIHKCGDNIYEPKDDGDFNQLPSTHTLEEKEHDLNGQYVLVSSDFVYYGSEAIILPAYMNFLKVGRAHRSRFYDDEIHTFIEYIKTLPRGIQGPPDTWPDNDFSWKI
jgi:hypothetical protein